MEELKKILETLIAQNASSYEKMSGMLCAQNAILNAVMHTLPNRPDLLTNLNTAHNATLTSLKDSNQSTAQIDAAESVFNSALVALVPSGHSDKERIGGLVDQIASNRNGILVLINILASQPGIDPDMLVDELTEASSVPNVMLNLPTVGLLEQMLEIVKRRNPET